MASNSSAAQHTHTELCTLHLLTFASYSVHFWKTRGKFAFTNSYVCLKAKCDTFGVIYIYVRVHRLPKATMC